MEDVSAEIASLNAKLAEAERVGKPIEYQTALINCLTELLKEENFLLNARTQGKAPTALFPCNYLIFCSFCCVLQLFLLFKVY
jgi:hypothetical protein